MTNRRSFLGLLFAPLALPLVGATPDLLPVGEAVRQLHPFGGAMAGPDRWHDDKVQDPQWVNDLRNLLREYRQERYDVVYCPIRQAATFQVQGHGDGRMPLFRLDRPYGRQQYYAEASYTEERYRTWTQGAESTIRIPVPTFDFLGLALVEVAVWERFGDGLFTMTVDEYSRRVYGTMTPEEFEWNLSRYVHNTAMGLLS